MRWWVWAKGHQGGYVLGIPFRSLDDATVAIKALRRDGYTVITVEAE